MQEKFPNFSIEEAMRLANSPAGKQLMALLQQQPKETLNTAADKAAAGDLNAAKATLSALLSSKEAQALMNQLRGDSHE